VINRQEIADFSREFGLTANVIEKDYMLGWLLAGISNHSELSASWAFKGGTCLKKCYFETYRFSEDLDYPYRGRTSRREFPGQCVQGNSRLGL
jgi:predicted nucleotidyltransferase component of viral defense system